MYIPVGAGLYIVTLYVKANSFALLSDPRYTDIYKAQLDLLVLQQDHIHHLPLRPSCLANLAKIARA